MDENYLSYINRVSQLTQKSSYQSQVQHLQESPKYQLDSSGKIQVVPFPGYTIITPPYKEDSDNTKCYSLLTQYQAQLMEQIRSNILIPLPPDSFHVTIADLIWNTAYLDATANPQFESKLQTTIGNIFNQTESTTPKTPIYWQLLGLSLRPRALLACFVPKDEPSYTQICSLRRSIYQNHDLISLGIEQHYKFIAHVTLGYFSKIPPDLDADLLCDTLSELSFQWVANDHPEILIKEAQLRKFDDMTCYYRLDHWPIFKF